MMMMIMEDQEAGKKLDTDSKGEVGQKYAGQVIPLWLYNFRATDEKDINQGDREKKQTDLINPTRRGKGIVSDLKI